MNDNILKLIIEETETDGRRSFAFTSVVRQQLLLLSSSAAILYFYLLFVNSDNEEIQFKNRKKWPIGRMTSRDNFLLYIYICAVTS